MGHKQLSRDERLIISELRKAGLRQSEIARHLNRSKATISREIRRNWSDGSYRAIKADTKAGSRRRSTRRHSQFTAEEYDLVNALLREKFSPEQIAGRLELEGRLSISHETIYKHIWRDRASGGSLWQHLRQKAKKRRKRYGSKDSRGKLAGKRSIDERPPMVEARDAIGHWEIDTVLGKGSKACLLTVVERATGFVLMGKLMSRTTDEVNRVLLGMIKQHALKMKTITADNGTEFHGYKVIETMTGVRIYFAHPHHSWERGTNENTNGLVRQYFPKGISLWRVTDSAINAVARALNNRPRKRLQFHSPAERFQDLKKVAI